MSTARRPVVAVTLGDPAGIGPELVARLLRDPETTRDAAVVVVGDEWLWQAGCRVAGTATRLATIQSFSAARGSASPAFLPLSTVRIEEVRPARADAAGGRSVLQALQLCLDAARAGEIDAICFAPLNKLAMKMAGLGFADELHWFADRLKVTGFFTEFNVLGSLWTSRITSHIPLREVAGKIDGGRIQEAARALRAAMIRAGMARPRLAVAGLNPHAGEGGTCGTEEIDVIAPAVAALRREGLDVQGPFPADTLFVRARKGEFDGVVTMYHDQGQIALKLLGFDRGVTVQGGLPVIITTPAHGTAFDIAGTGRADPGAMIEAFRLAAGMGRQPPSPSP